MTTQPILAFDCATSGASIALMHRGDIATRTIGQTAQAAELVPAIDGLLRAAGLAYAELGGIVTTVGPGSFTGVRIGLATVHGLVLAHATPLKTLSTLEAMAWAIAMRAEAPGEFIISLRAGKGEIYAQRFQLDRAQEKTLRPIAIGEIALHPETRAEWDAPCFGNQLAPDDANYIAGPDAATLCTIAHHLPTTSLADALPLYIRPPDALPPAPLSWLAN